MSMHLLRRLHCALVKTTVSTNRRKQRRSHKRALSLEPLESRQMFSVAAEGGVGEPTGIALQDGLFPNITYFGTSDTKINSNKPRMNYGSARTFHIDGNPDSAALFKWDVSATPAGTVVTSAAIELHVTNATKQSYELFALQRAWDELSATWQRYSTDSNWSSSGADGAGDHSADVLGRLGPAGKGVHRINLNEAGVAAVQAWINNADQNFGIILQDYAVSDGVDVSTSEAWNAAQRPKLIINLQDAAPPSTLPNKTEVAWQLNELFSDEFNDGALDELKWDTRYRNWTGRNPGIFDPANVSVVNGYLALDVEMPAAGTLPVGKQYTTSTINTTGGDPGSVQRDILYGFLEIRAQGTDAETTSAFWLHKNAPENWNEIDIAELRHTAPRTMPTNLHVIRENGVEVVPGGSLRFPESVSFAEANIPANQNYYNSFHTYGLDWNPQTIDFYLDGVLVRSVANDHWHQPMNINLTNSMQEWNGLPTAAELDAVSPFLIDYIRVYDATPTSNPNPLANLAPVVNVGPNLTAVRNQPLAISGVASDDGKLAGSALLAVRWNKLSGPGTVTFGDDEAASTTAQFSVVGNYLLRMTVSDGELYGFDELNVTVN